MLTAGDEFLRTQKGNNNAWCQDNETSWVDWALAETTKEFLRFAREMIRFRKRHPALRRPAFFRGEFARPEVAQPPASGDSGRLKRPAAKTPPLPPALARLADIYWHGTEPHAPDFSAESRVIALTIDGRFTGRDDVLPSGRDADIYVAINGGDVATAFLIPPSPQGKRWRRVVDTGLASPDDITPDEAAGKLVADGSRYPVGPFALIVLVTES
jgi:glycogen operon protein